MIRSFYELSPATHSFLLLTGNFQGLNEAIHVATTRFQHLLWPQLGCHIGKLSHNRFLYPNTDNLP